MNGLERCPNCFKLPEVKFEDKGPDHYDVIFSCPQHGHMAMGTSVEGATANWNLYVMLLRNKATV